MIGLSILSGAHESICRRLNEELSRREARIPIVVGGIIPAADFAKLKDLGVAAVFGPESPLAAVVETVRELATKPERMGEILGAALLLIWAITFAVGALLLAVIPFLHFPFQLVRCTLSLT